MQLYFCVVFILEGNKMTDRRNIFISHSHKDDAGLQDVKDLAAKHGLVMSDGSINSDKPNNAKNDDYIMQKIIRPRIEWCSVLMVYITPETKNSEWVNREIEMAHKKDKRIVGVWERGHAGCEIPEALQDYADAVVGWDGGKIVAAVNGDFDGCEDRYGNLAPPIDRTRIKCQ